MKNVQEWSLEFDLLYNNIASDKAPGIEEYEKSVVLTRAQEGIVVSLYKGNFGEAFENTEEVSIYLGNLVTQGDFYAINPADPKYPQKLSKDSVVFHSPDDLLFRTWEGCTIDLGECGYVDVPVIPITQDEYWRIVRNPFRKHNDRRVLRLTFSEENTNSGNLNNKFYSELISQSPIIKYTVRYLKRPNPIILTDLTGGLSINGQTSARTCELDEALHQFILAEAVKMAKAIWMN